MPSEDCDRKRSGSLEECIQEVISTGLSGMILYQDATIIRAMVIVVSGEPAGAEYTDTAGSIFGDTAIFKLPIHTLYTITELPTPMAQTLAGLARLYHPKRLYAHASKKTGPIGKSSGEANSGRISIKVEGIATSPIGLRIELWNRGLIVASDTLDHMGSASFRLLKGEYECRLRNSVGLISRSPISFSGGDVKITIDYRGSGG